MKKLFFLLFFLIVSIISVYGYYPGDVIGYYENAVNVSLPCLLINNSIYVSNSAPPGSFTCNITYLEEDTYQSYGSPSKGGNLKRDVVIVNNTSYVKKEIDYSFLKSYCGNGICDGFEKEEWYCESDCKKEEEIIDKVIEKEPETEKNKYKWGIIIGLSFIASIVFIYLRRRFTKKVKLKSDYR